MKSSFAIRVFIAYLFAVLAQTPVAAQSLSNLTGEVTGTGHIDSRWQVELRAVNESRASPPERAYLQPDGRFQFPQVRPGAYEITLIGPDQNQMTREYTNVNGYGGSVQIRFNPKTTERPRGAISLQRLAHKVPKAAGKEYAKARRERDKKHAAEAERHYLKALELDPQFLEAANDLGALYYTLARYADSLRVLEQARVIEPDSPQVLANLSANLMALGRHGDAEPLARRSMAIDPTSIRTRYLLGLSRMGQRKLDAETRGLLEEASLEIPHAKFALERFNAVSGARKPWRAPAAGCRAQSGPGRQTCAWSPVR